MLGFWGDEGFGIDKWGMRISHSRALTLSIRKNGGCS